jgi:pimeloyl-ACP methyl ester carboxylesterase
MTDPGGKDHRTSQTFRLPDGRTLAYAEYGCSSSAGCTSSAGASEGKPVFYFHGLPGSRLDGVMLEHDDLVKAGIRLIAPDRPGMGGSDFQPGRGFSHWPLDIVALADSLGLEKFGVFGVSGGGGYVSACARLIPDRLSSAVIVSGAGRMDSPEARAGLPFMGWVMWALAGRSFRLARLFMELTKPRKLGDPAQIRQQMMQTMPPSESAFFEKPGRLEAFIASTLECMRPGVGGMAWELHLYARPWDFNLEDICFPPTNCVRRTNCVRVRLLHGEADQNVPVAVARKVAASIPDCQATFYPGERHLGLLANHLDEVTHALGED